MSGQISEEAMLILMSIYGGIVLIICYDVVRILRRIFPAKLFRVIVEDAIYWTFASIFMFNIFLRYNYGKPRFFSVIMALGTMAVFEWIIGRKIIDALALRIKKRLFVKSGGKKIFDTVVNHCSQLCFLF